MGLGAGTTAADEGAWLQEWLRERVAAERVPRVVRVVGEIPKNAMGKVNKKALAQEWVQSES